MKLLQAKDAFDMNAVKEAYDKAVPTSYKVTDIQGPFVGEIEAKFGEIWYYSYYILTFRELNSPDRYTVAYDRKIDELNHKALYQTIQEVLGKHIDIGKIIQDDVKMFTIESKYQYIIPDMIDPRTNSPVTSNLHAFFLFADDSLLKEVTKRVRELDWIVDTPHTDLEFDFNKTIPTKLEITKAQLIQHIQSSNSVDDIKMWCLTYYQDISEEQQAEHDAKVEASNSLHATE